MGIIIEINRVDEGKVIRKSNDGCSGERMIKKTYVSSINTKNIYIKRNNVGKFYPNYSFVVARGV